MSSGLTPNLQSVFSEIGIKKGDTIFLHGDAGIAAQFKGQSTSLKISNFFDEILNYVGPTGTVVVPNFTYSFTRNIDFNYEETPSNIGLFSESFRTLPNSVRSTNPLFSVSSIGKNTTLFKNSNSESCFGIGTSFDLLLKLNAKIICLGCDFNRVTFVHYVEEFFNVPYRYHKSFFGKIIIGSNTFNSQIDYFVRDMSIKSNCNLNSLKKQLISHGKLKEESLGRYNVTTVSAHDFFTTGIEMLKNNIYSLIDEGYV